MKFSVGDWVSIQEHRFTDALGYIVAVDEFREMFSVRLVRNVKGDQMQIPVSYWFTDSQLIHAELETVEGVLPYLIDLSLDMNDKKWFAALVSQLK